MTAEVPMKIRLTFVRRTSILSITDACDMRSGFFEVQSHCHLGTLHLALQPMLFGSQALCTLTSVFVRHSVDGAQNQGALFTTSALHNFHSPPFRVGLLECMWHVNTSSMIFGRVWTKNQNIERQFDDNSPEIERFIKYPYIHNPPIPIYCSIHGFPTNSYK